MRDDSIRIEKLRAAAKAKRRAEAKARAATAECVRLAEEARADYMPAAAIAEALGISRQRVYALLDRSSD